MNGYMADVGGTMTALVTPFRGEDVDWDRWATLIERQIDAGVGWLVPCGTTGESPTLTESEHGRLVEETVTRAAGRSRVMAGTGTYCTRETVHRTKRATQAGVDAVLIVTPYYNRPTNEGLFRHYAAVADAVDVPMVLYNVPARTGVTLQNEVVVRLREAFPHIVAIKHATGSTDGVSELLSRCDITVLSGDDVLTLPLMSLGATGVVSVLSNLLPALVVELVQGAGRGPALVDSEANRVANELSSGLGRLGPNPVPIKTAMAAAGLLEEVFRLPLCPLDDATRSLVARWVSRLGVWEQAGTGT